MKKARTIDGDDAARVIRGAKDALSAFSIERALHQESGQHDYRMVPVALATWGVCLILTTVQGWRPMILYGLLLAPITAIVLLKPLRLLIAHHKNLLPHIVLVLVAGWCVTVSTGVSGYIASQDPAFVSDKVPGVSAEFEALTPPVAAVLKGWDCQYRARLSSVESQEIWSASSLEVMVYAQDSGCAVVESAHYAASGTLAPARFGKDSVWFSLEASDDVVPASVTSDSAITVGLREIRAADSAHSVIARMRSAFVAQCQNLGEQGRILVPGVTMGVLGQEVVSQRQSDEESYDDNAAGTLIEANFKNSGIVHLLAVSGGHFVVVAALLKKLSALLHLPRLPTAAVIAVGYWFLGLLMFPSDSVLRAFVMGAFGVGATVLGRPAQAMSSLCWTVILTLIVVPGFATSFGFALSCAAVMGIVMFNTAIEAFLPRRLPAWIKEATALSISAQVLTLPVQLLMSPSLPLWSVAANICVAPFVTFSTLCGLGSLMISWVVPGVGRSLAFIASLGTEVMNRCASAFGGSAGGVIEVKVPGTVAALLILVIESAIGILVWWWTKHRPREMS